MTSIYCFGDIMYEQHIYLNEYENSNDSLVKSLKFKVGGSAFNTANGLAEMGNKVNLISSIGTDIEGKYLKEILSSNRGAKSSHLKISSQGLAHVYFEHGEFKSNYYLVEIK